MEEKEIKDLQNRVEFLENFIKDFYVTQMGYAGREEVLNTSFQRLEKTKEKLKEEVENG